MEVPILLDLNLFIAYYSICSNLVKRSVTVVFEWVPSHIGITGNEIADINAIKSLKEPNINISVNFNYQEIMSLVMSRIVGLWQLGWDNRNRPWHYSIKPTIHSAGPVSINNNYTKPITRLRVGVLTGLASTKFKLRQATSPNCVSCGVLEDIKHFLLHCERYRLERNVLKQFLDNHNLPFNERTILNPRKNIKNKIDRLLIIYIKKSKIVV